MKKIILSITNNVVELLLVLLFIASTIGYFVNDMNYTMFLAIAAFYTIVSIIEKERFLKALISIVVKNPNIKGWEILTRLKIKHTPDIKPERDIFSTIVRILLILSIIFMLTITVVYLVSPDI